MILNDKQIIELVATKKMITPFEDRFRVLYPSNRGKISWGLTSFGYDLRAAYEWKIFEHRHEAGKDVLLDPKKFDETSCYDFYGARVVIPPNSFALARSVEYIRMPDDVVAIAVGKSTYARIGIIANVTPLEPGWEGHVTLEFSNTTPYPAVMYANEGVVQLMFYQGERPQATYADKQGKYQGQTGITLPKV